MLPFGVTIPATVPQGSEIPDPPVSYYQFSTYTGCPGRNVKNFGSVFLMSKYTDITQNTYIQS
jgi:hypothetical protein